LRKEVDQGQTTSARRPKLPKGIERTIKWKRGGARGLKKSVVQGEGVL